MEEKLEKNIKSELNYTLNVEEDGVYAVTIKASCRPGWRNPWWLKIKGILEDIVDLHLDDDDLRIEIDGLVFKKPNGIKGLFNSPAAFSGTKTLGKIKTVILATHLNKGEHTLRFIPKGFPYLERVTLELLDDQSKFRRYFNLRAEKENYYSWYTLVPVKQRLNNFLLTAKADKTVDNTDDGDLKVAIDGEVQANKESRHPKSYFCGFNLKGKEETFSKELSLTGDVHYIELIADNQPTLVSLNLSFGEKSGVIPVDPKKSKEAFNPEYILKDSAFTDSSSLKEEEIEAFLKKHGEKYPNHIYHKVIEGRKVSFWIKKFTFESELNPKIILTKLQVEKGLIIGETSVNPTQDQLDWALGAGSLDTGNVEQYGEFFTQLKEAPYLFRSYFVNIKEAPFTHSNVDGRPLTTVNKATLAFYRYTPHLAGANLFYRVYSQFFGNDDLGGEI